MCLLPAPLLLLLLHLLCVLARAEASIIYTLAGQYGVVTFTFGEGDNGPANASTLSQVMGVVQDSAGNLYYSDWPSIKKYNPATGIQTNFAGTGANGSSGDGGPATSATFSAASYGGGLAIDTARNVLYVADYGNGVVRSIDLATGVVRTFAGTGGDAGYGGDGGLAINAKVGALGEGGRRIRRKGLGVQI